MAPWSIYTLTDPREPERVRYVGFTSIGLKKRLRNHLKEAGDYHKSRWIKKLVREGITPTIAEIDSGDDPDWANVEQAWIAHYRDAGHNLTNGTLGGEGTPGRTVSEETRRKIGAAHKGKNFRLGYKHSAETKRKIGTANKGNSPSAEHRISLSNKLSKPVVCVETGDRFTSMKAAAEKYGVRQGNISKSVHKGHGTGGLHWQVAA